MTPRGSGSVDPLLDGTGLVGRDMAAVDWSSTPLGDPAHWPTSLRSVVRTMLTSRFAMWMAWGPELTVLYNDAYRRDTLQAKHPGSLARPASEVWSEIWPDIGPRIRTVLDTGRATWDEDLPLFIERSGYSEETFHTFSYSPLAEEDGTVRGMLCVVTENTDRVLGERRMATLRELATAVGTTRTRDDVLGAVGTQLARNDHDLPFALVYLADEAVEPDVLRLARAVGVTDASGVPPELLRTGEGPWPVERVRDGRTFVVDDLAGLAGPLPTGAWSRPPGETVVIPLVTAPAGPDGSGAGRAVAGCLVVGLNPHRALDESYRGFLELVAGQIAAGLVTADSYEAERGRAEALAELDRAKTDFFSNVSHEFRTPLALIMAPVEELLAEPEVDPERWRAELDTVRRNGLRLGRLVNSLLDFSRLQAGRVRARFEPVDLAELTADLAGVFRSAMERAGLGYTVDCPPLPSPVHVDREAWEKVVLNLLSNAVKFTFDGTVTVSVRPGPGAAVLTVSDTGVGIPADELPRLFERFHRVAGTRARSGEGSGIGLAMVRELVTLHGGEIEADSEPGAGTRFTVTVPLGSDHLPADQVQDGPVADERVGSAAAPFVAEVLQWVGSSTAVETPSVPEPATAPVVGRVLVADDNADMRAYLHRLLAPYYAVEVVADGRAALAAARTDAPDLVVSDVMMPELDGMGLLAELRADSRTARVPVLLLSARAGQEAAVEGLGAQADDYLVKPFAASELLARVGAHLRLGQVRRRAEARFTAMADLAPALIWVAEPDGSRVFLNAGWRRFTGRDTADELGDGWLAGLHPADREGYLRTTADAAGAGRGWEAEYRLRRADGAYHWVVEQAAPVTIDGAGADDAAAHSGWVGSCIDVHERYREGERQRLLAQVGTELDGETGVDRRLGRLVRLLIDTRFGDRCVVHRVDDDGGLRASASAALDRDTAATLDATEAHVASVHEALQDRAPVLGPDTEPARIHLPLVVRERVVAVLSLHRRADAPRYTADDRGLLAEIAGRAALAIDNALLLAEERAAAERLGLLQRATAQLSAAASPAQVAAVVADQLCRLLGTAGRIGIFEYDPQARSLTALALHGTDDPHYAALPLSTPALVTAAVRAEEPVRVAEPDDGAETPYPELLALLREAGLRGAIGLPLVAAGRTVGAIGIGLADRRRLTTSEHTTLQALAEPCALALDRARLYRAEHRIARTLQRSLLPERLPELDRLALAARYLPGAEGTAAGGDWYDVVELDEHRVALAVGDVVGQGTPAAAVMGQLRTVLSGYLVAGHGPATALDLLDRVTARIPAAKASTAACMVIDTEAGTLRWARAGHLPPLLVNDGRPRYLDGREGHGPLLGLVTGRSAHSEGVVALRPGDTLVLYTDGLVERRREVLDTGFDRLRTAVERHQDEDPEPLASALMSEVAEHGGRSDDVALVVARLMPPALERRFPARAEELAGLRRAVARWSAQAALPPDQVEDLQLTLGEAATNAVEHAYRDVPGGEVDVRLARRGDGVVVGEVHDHGTWRAVPADPGHRGRGLAIIRRLSDESDVDGGDTGTVVRFTLAPPPPEETPAATSSSTPAPVGSAATLEVHDDALWRRLVVRGDLDLAGLRALRTRVLAAVDTASTAVLVDLEGVGYLASAGVRLLVEAVEHGRDQGRDVEIRTVPGSGPARIFGLGTPSG